MLTVYGRQNSKLLLRGLSKTIMHADMLACYKVSSRVRIIADVSPVGQCHTRTVTKRRVEGCCVCVVKLD